MSVTPIPLATAPLKLDLLLVGGDGHRYVMHRTDTVHRCRALLSSTTSINGRSSAVCRCPRPVAILRDHVIPERPDQAKSTRRRSIANHHRHAVQTADGLLRPDRSVPRFFAVRSFATSSKRRPLGSLNRSRGSPKWASSSM